MRDPLGPAPASVVKLLQPFAQRYALLTLPLHAHEIVGAFLLYTSISTVISPYLTKRFLSQTYRRLPQKSQLEWHIRVVSTFQSTLICALAFLIIAFDHDRRDSNYEERLWGYSGVGGMLQALVAGYFLWDVYISVQYLSILGWGSLAHGISALLITCMGFRPFANYYGVNFILYELSTPCLNIHWFFDKLGYTGTKRQLVNGICLISIFFGCRLVWGTFQSWNIYKDVWAAWSSPSSMTEYQGSAYLGANSSSPGAISTSKNNSVPIWLLVVYLLSNTVLSFLNFYWFGKMIKTLRKRFEAPPKTTKKA